MFISEGTLILFFALFLFSAAFIVYHMDGVLRENLRLRNRNYELAQCLQTAELQTGTPYYSATLRDLVMEKSNGLYYESLESRIRGLGAAPVSD